MRLADISDKVHCESYDGDEGSRETGKYVCM